MLLSKSDILNGKNSVHTVKVEKLGGSLKVRPITDGEYSEITRIMTQGGMKTLKGKVTPEDARNRQNKKDGKPKQGDPIDYEVDPMEAAKCAYEADVKAVFYGLQHKEAEESFSEDDINAFPAGSVEELAVKIYEISGVDDPNKTRKNMREFREEESGTGS